MPFVTVIFLTIYLRYRLSYMLITHVFGVHLCHLKRLHDLELVGLPPPRNSFFIGFYVYSCFFDLNVGIRLSNPHPMIKHKNPEKLGFF